MNQVSSTLANLAARNDGTSKAVQAGIKGALQGKAFRSQLKQELGEDLYLRARYALERLHEAGVALELYYQDILQTVSGVVGADKLQQWYLLLEPKKQCILHGCSPEHCGCPDIISQTDLLRYEREVPELPPSVALSGLPKDVSPSDKGPFILVEEVTRSGYWTETNVIEVRKKTTQN